MHAIDDEIRNVVILLPQNFPSVICIIYVGRGTCGGIGRIFSTVFDLVGVCAVLHYKNVNAFSLRAIENRSWSCRVVL